MKRNILWTIAAAILFSCTDSMQEYAAMDDFNNSVQMEPDRSLSRNMIYDFQVASH